MSLTRKLAWRKPSLPLELPIRETLNIRGMGPGARRLVDLISEHERLLNIPQHLLYYTISDASEADNIAVDEPRDISISSIPSVATTTPQPLAKAIIPDFAILHIIFCWRDPDGPKRWRNVKI